MSQELSTDLYPTVGQLERAISQKVRALYRNQFGHQPSRVDCHFINNKLIISLEDVMTPIEKLLVENQSSTLISQIRGFIDEHTKLKLKELVEEISQVSVDYCLYDTAIETGFAGAILILDSPPQVRRSRSLARKNKSTNQAGHYP